MRNLLAVLPIVYGTKNKTKHSVPTTPVLRSLRILSGGLQSCPMIGVFAGSLASRGVASLPLQAQLHVIVSDPMFFAPNFSSLAISQKPQNRKGSFRQLRNN